MGEEIKLIDEIVVYIAISAFMLLLLSAIFARTWTSVLVSIAPLALSFAYFVVRGVLEKSASDSDSQ